MTSQVETQVLIPGERVDRRGRAQPRGQIRRIAVIKPDHIGDLLIASRAFRLLRHFFPRARLELICGPWNVELARQLGLFDDVHGVNLFHEVSGQQQDLSVARAMWRAGIGALENLKLGAFDIAIDMRHDRDSRALLLSIDASVYAGYGSIPEFPFLDILLPTHSSDGRAGESREIYLVGQNFHRIAAAMDPAGPRTRGSGMVMAERNAIELDLFVKGAKSPAACGTFAQDLRELSVAIRHLRLSPVGDEARIHSWSPRSLTPRDPDVVLLAGWAALEDWGVWGEGSLSRVRIALPPPRGETHVRLALSLLGHVNPHNQLVECTAHAAGVGGNVIFRYPRNEGELVIEVPRFETAVKLACEPFRLAPGSYKGMLRIYLPMAVAPGMSLTMTLRGLYSAAALMTRAAGGPILRPGLCDIPFDCEVETGDEPLSLEVYFPDAAAWQATRIEMLSIECVKPMKLNGPIAHMEQHASMLALRVAMEFSDVAPFGPDDIPARLTTRRIAAGLGPGSRSDLDELLERIASWQQEGACVVGIALGCNTDIRKWPMHYFIELARPLVAMPGVKLLFIGSPDDRAEADEACRILGLEPLLHSACGKTKLHELGCLLQPLDLFIGSNTGTTHFAGRLGVRTVGIYAGTNHPREWGPIGENASWITRDEKCAPCSLTDLKDCRFGHVCMRNLLPDDVLPVVLPEVQRTLSERALVPVPA
jgi:ADP-heptose:LPS heptosyltransferase